MNAALKFMPYRAPSRFQGIDEAFPNILNPAQGSNFYVGKANTTPRVDFVMPSKGDILMVFEKAIQEEFQYPKILIQCFAASIVLSGLGFIALIVCFFQNYEVAFAASTVLLALGSMGIALTLIRGQDLSDQNRHLL